MYQNICFIGGKVNKYSIHFREIHRNVFRKITKDVLFLRRIRRQSTRKKTSAEVRLIHAEQMSLYIFIILRKKQWIQMKTKQLKQDILNQQESIGFLKLDSCKVFLACPQGWNGSSQIFRELLKRMYLGSGMWRCKKLRSQPNIFFSLIISQIIRESGTQGPTLGFQGGEYGFIALGVDASQGNVCKIHGQQQRNSFPMPVAKE